MARPIADRVGHARGVDGDEMSEEQANIDILDALNARKYRPLTPEQRARKQQIFLKAYGEHGVVKYACKAAGVSRQTYKNWRDTDEAFKAQLPEAREEVCDTLEHAAYEQAVVGVFEPLVSMGQPVYEQIPVLDSQGEPELDSKGRPKMKRGAMLTRRVLSATLLQTLLKANMPEKYKDKQQVEHSGSIDVAGARELLQAKINALREQGE